MLVLCVISSYYTSREDTLILLDETHVSRLLATFVFVNSLTAVNIQHISNRCQGDDVFAYIILLRTSRFQDPHAWGNVSRPEQNAAVNNGITLLLKTTIKKITCASVSI